MGTQRRPRIARHCTGLLAGIGYVLLTGGVSSANAQELALGQDIPIAIAIPPEIEEEFGPAVRTQLESRMTQFATASGMAAVDGMANIVMYPLLLIIDEQRTAGLLENLDVVRLEVSIYVKNVQDGTLYASMSREVVGSGRTREAAVRMAVRQLSGRDPAMREFTADARMRIVEYYERNCDQIIREGRTLAAGGEVQDALALILAVPGEASSCHERANEEAVTLFNRYEATLCAERVRRAEAEMAVDRFIESIDALTGISDTGPCGQRADQLIREIQVEIGDRADATSAAHLERYRAFTDTIGSGVGQIEGPAAAVRERTIIRAKMEATVVLNRPSARSYPPGIFQTRR